MVAHRRRCRGRRWHCAVSPIPAPDDVRGRCAGYDFAGGSARPLPW